MLKLEKHHTLDNVSQIHSYQLQWADTKVLAGVNRDLGNMYCGKHQKLKNQLDSVHQW